MTGNDHVRFGPEAAGKGPASGHLADGLPVSRAVMAARFGFAEDTVRLAAALRPALAARGVPEHVYVDNGSAFVDAWLLRACAKLGIKLVHSQPGQKAGGRSSGFSGPSAASSWPS
jgi:hypothetical protein